MRGKQKPKHYTKIASGMRKSSQNIGNSLGWITIWMEHNLQIVLTIVPTQPKNWTWPNTAVSYLLLHFVCVCWFRTLFIIFQKGGQLCTIHRIKKKKNCLYTRKWNSFPQHKNVHWIGFRYFFASIKWRFSLHLGCVCSAPAVKMCKKNGADGLARRRINEKRMKNSVT